MNPTDFAKDSPGRLVPVPEGVHAFVPEPLPSRLPLDSEAVQLLAEASLELGHLRGIALQLPNPQLLVRPFMRREAELSSRIEGTYASQEELLLFEVQRPTQAAKPDVREVANYVAALEMGLKRLSKLPVCLRLICELHARLMRGARGADRRPGEFRRGQNYIAQHGAPISEARYVPPPPGELDACLNAFERWLHAESALPQLVRLALVHYQFEAIHPFGDGNGRIGRLLLPLLLAEWKLLPRPLFQLSAYFERNRASYYDHLLRVSQTGDWLEWVRFFLRGVAEQAQDAAKRSQQLLDLRQAYREKLQTAGASSLLVKLVDGLFITPALSISLAAARLKLSYPGAQHNVEKLVRAGILIEATGQKRNRVYLAPEILAILVPPSKTAPAHQAP